ncbi:MAG TPA: hypothetical protein VGK73_34950 [Polyangiaceae bacterium]
MTNLRAAEHFASTWRSRIGRHDPLRGFAPVQILDGTARLLAWARRRGW